MTTSIKEIINEVEVQAWTQFDMEYRPKPVCDFEIFVKSKGEYFNPSVNQWSEKQTKGECINYEGEDIFLSTHLYMEKEGGVSKMFFFDAVFDGGNTKWTLRNSIYHKKSPAGNKEPIFLLFKHHRDSDSLAITDVDKFYEFKEAEEAAKNKLIIGKSYYSEDSHISIDQCDIMAQVINPDDAEYRMASTRESEANKTIIVDFFNDDQERYEIETFKKILYILQSFNCVKGKSLFKREGGNDGARLLIGLGFNKAYVKLVEMMPHIPSWINPQGIDEDEMFGVPVTILAHAGHRAYIDGLEQIERLNRIYKFNADIHYEMFYKLFMFLDADSKGAEVYNPLPIMDRVILQLEVGRGIDDALEDIQTKEAA